MFAAILALNTSILDIKTKSFLIHLVLLDKVIGITMLDY